MVMHNRIPFTTNQKRNCRLGVLPKRPHLTPDKKCDVRWFELDSPLVILHTINAWEEGDTIRLFTCFFDKVSRQHMAGAHPAAAPCLHDSAMPSSPAEAVQASPACRPCTCLIHAEVDAETGGFSGAAGL